MRRHDGFADLFLGQQSILLCGTQSPIQSIFYRRSGPIAAAIAITVEMPEDAELPE